MSNQDYHQHLGDISEADIAYVLKKDVQYDSSWKRRGGAGAFFTIARPWDRLENMAKQSGYDVFQRLADEGLVGPDGSLIACIRDLRRYLLLLEAEVFHRSIGGSDADIREQVDQAIKFDLGSGFSRSAEHLDEEPGSPANGGHHERIYDDVDQRHRDEGLRPPPRPHVERLEDGLRAPSEAPSISVVDTRDGGLYYNIDRRAVAHDLTDHLPRLDVELNHKEWMDLVPEYRGMYLWHEGPSKYLLKPEYRVFWGRAA